MFINILLKRRQNFVVFDVANSLPHALVGFGVYVTAVAVPLPGAPQSSKRIMMQEKNLVIVHALKLQTKINLKVMIM